MKTASAGLITILNSSDQVYIADLYTITLNNGTVLKYTNADTTIETFIAGDLQIERGDTRIVRGVQVDTLKLNVYYSPSNNFAQMIQSGALDGARVLLQRAIMPTFGDISNGLITMFSGRISDAEFDRTKASINIKSDFELLNIQMPRNLYQPSCSHSLYSVGCGVLKASFSVSGSIVSASTTQTLNTGLSQVGGIFSQGIIEFTSGQNNGVKRTVKLHNDRVISITLPLSYQPQIGDTFTISQGCDKTMNTCNIVFNNLSRYRGFPFVPQPEAAR